MDADLEFIKNLDIQDVKELEDCLLSLAQQLFDVNNTENCMFPLDKINKERTIATLLGASRRCKEVQERSYLYTYPSLKQGNLILHGCFFTCLQGGKSETAQKTLLFRLCDKELAIQTEKFSNYFPYLTEHGIIKLNNDYWNGVIKMEKLLQGEPDTKKSNNEYNNTESIETKNSSVIINIFYIIILFVIAYVYIVCVR